jgi:hypothetical protein
MGQLFNRVSQESIIEIRTDELHHRDEIVGQHVRRRRSKVRPVTHRVQKVEFDSCTQGMS